MDRYLLRELLLPLTYCLGGFLVFYVAFDLMFHMNQFQEKRLFFTDVVEFYAVTLPDTLANQVIPVSLLLASLYALTNHNRYNELVAFRAAGVSLGRLALPYLAVGALCGLAIFSINEFWVPRVSDSSKMILERRIDPLQDRNWTGRLDFHNDADRRHWLMERYNKSTSEMTSPSVVWVTPDRAFHWISAATGIYTNKVWRFTEAERWDQAADQPAPVLSTNHATLELEFSEKPDAFRTEIKVINTDPKDAVKDPKLSITELLSYLHSHHQMDRSRREGILTQLQGRLAAPFTCLAVVLIALPFGARGGRKNVFVGVAGGIFFCFAYFILQRICVGLGIGGYLPPIIAAWLPNLLFGVMGMVLIRRLP